MSWFWIRPPSRIEWPLLTLIVLVSRRWVKVGELMVEEVVVSTSLTDWLISMVTKPPEFTRGVTSRMMPVSLYWTLLSTNGLAVTVLVAVWVMIGTTSPTWSRAV